MFKIKSLFKYQTSVYPLVKMIKITSVIIGVLLVISCSPKNELSNNQIGNPFTFADLSEPYEYRHREAQCGTVSSPEPLWLSAEETHAIVHKVFKDKGIDLQKDYFYQRDSVRVVLDGFDPQSNIGYIWTKPYTVQYYDSALSLQISGFDMAVLERILNKTSEKKSDKVWHQRFEAAKKITNDEEKLQAYRVLYLDDIIEWRLNKGKNKSSFEYLKKYNVNSNTSFEEKEKLRNASLLIDACEDGIDIFGKKKTLREILYDIIDIEDEKERRHQYNNFGIFLAVYGDGLREVKQKILSNQDKAIIANEIQKFGLNFLDKKLSLREARYLENPHKTEGDFIAIIDTRDKRFTYLSAGLDGRRYREIKQEKGNEGVRKAQEEEESRAKEDHAKTLKTFEAHVLQYIRWAKQQGRH